MNTMTSPLPQSPAVLVRPAVEGRRGVVTVLLPQRQDIYSGAAGPLVPGQLHPEPGADHGADFPAGREHPLERDFDGLHEDEV